jgi:hypothetical protein
MEANWVIVDKGANREATWDVLNEMMSSTKTDTRQTASMLSR